MENTTVRTVPNVSYTVHLNGSHEVKSGVPGASEEQSSCPSCGQWQFRKANYCGDCGNLLPWGTPYAVSGTPENVAA